MKLSSKTVAALALPAGKRDHIEWCDDLSGFGYRLRLGSGGKVLRSWVAQYRRAGGTRRATLGSAQVLDADSARAAAKKVLAKVALGEDPQADRIDRRNKDRLSTRSVIDEYLATKEREVRTRTFRELKRYLAGPHFKPLHRMPIDAVSRRDVAARLVVITRENGSITALRARAALNAFFVWAMTMGVVESNPIIGTLKPKNSKPRERILSDSELAAVWRACRHDDYGRIIRLLILLGARRQEVGGMAWSELDLEGGQWVLPSQRSKNGRAHALPLPPMALDIISSVPRMATRDQLFGVRGAGFSRWSVAKRELDARSGVAGWAVHDLRRTFSTRLHDLGAQPHVAEQILNHQSHRGQVGGTYNRSPYEREVKAALAMWDDHIRVLVEDGERKVVSLQRPAS
jgi:integrase